MSKPIEELCKLLNELLSCNMIERWLGLYDQILQTIRDISTPVTPQVAQASGLVKVIQSIINYHQTLLCTKSLNRIEILWAERFCDFHFHLRLVQVLFKWTLPDVKELSYDSCRLFSPTISTTPDTPATFLIQLFLKGQLWLPVNVELYSLFFLVSMHNFCHHWHLWMKSQLGTTTDGRAKAILQMQPSDLYPSVMRLLVEAVDGRSILMDTVEPTAVNAANISLFKETVVRSVELRNDSSDVLRKCSCPQGQHRCRRDVIVDELEESDLPELFKPLSQRLVQERGWEVIQPMNQNGEIDVVRLKRRTVVQGQEELVGLIIYNAMKHEVWERLKAHHAELIGSLPNTNRSVKKMPVFMFQPNPTQTEIEMNATTAPHSEPVTVDFRPKGHKLVPAGRRVPQGGATGDTFSHYAWMSAETKEDRDRLFMVAHDMNCMLSGIQAQDNSTRAFAKRVFAIDGPEPGSGVGSYDHAAFYVRQDMHNQHTDNDSGWTVALTLEKQARDLEGAFAFTKYGKVLNQISNTLFIFDSGLIHGSVFPIETGVNDLPYPDWSANHNNQGIVTVLRKKDRDAAEFRHQIQHLNPRVWELFNGQ